MKDPLRGVTNKDMRRLLQQVRAAGHPVELTNGGHVRINTPAGPYFVGTTQPAARSVLEARTALARRGITLEV